MSVIYRIKHEVSTIDNDNQRMQYLTSIGQEINRLISIIQAKNSTSFVEVIQEENQKDEPVCNQD